MRFDWIRYIAPPWAAIVLLAAAEPPAHGAYLTGQYWELPGGDYRYGVTAWNNEPEDRAPIWWISLYPDRDVFDVTGPSGWRHAAHEPHWKTYDPELWIWPGDWLSGFDFSADFEIHQVPYVLKGTKQHGVLEFEFIPEPSLGFAVPVLLLGAYALKRRSR